MQPGSSQQRCVFKERKQPRKISNSKMVQAASEVIEADSKKVIVQAQG